MPSTDPVEVFDHFVLREIFSHVPPRQVVTSLYNVSKGWREFYRRANVCSPIYDRMEKTHPSLRRVDVDVLERTDLDWRSACLAHLKLDKAWSRGESSVIWSPKILEYDTTESWGDAGLSISLSDVGPDGTVIAAMFCDETWELTVFDLDLEPVKRIPIGRQIPTIRIPTLDHVGHVLCLSSTDEDLTFELVELWVQTEAAALFGVTHEQQAPPPADSAIDGFRYLTSFKVPCFGTGTGNMTLRAERTASDAVAIMAVIEGESAALDIERIATTQDGVLGANGAGVPFDPARLHPRRVQSIQIQPQDWVEERKLRHPKIFMDLTLTPNFVIAQASNNRLQVYSRTTSELVLSIPGAQPFRPVAVYDMDPLTVRSLSGEENQTPGAGVQQLVPVLDRTLLPGVLQTCTDPSVPDTHTTITGGLYNPWNSDFCLRTHYVCGDDLVLGFDLSNAVVVKNYDTVMHMAEALPMRETLSLVEKNSIMVGGYANHGEVACSRGSRFVIHSDLYTFLLDTSTMVLPSTAERASAPDMPLTFWYSGDSDFYQSRLSPYGIIEIVLLDQWAEPRWHDAQAHARILGRSMPEWDKWWTWGVYPEDLDSDDEVEGLPAYVLARTNFELA